MDKDNRLIQEMYTEAWEKEEYIPTEIDKKIIRLFKDNNVVIKPRHGLNLYGEININPQTGEQLTNRETTRYEKEQVKSDFTGGQLISLYFQKVGMDPKALRRAGHVKARNKGLFGISTARMVINTPVGKERDASGVPTYQRRGGSWPELSKHKKLEWIDMEKPGWEEWMVNAIKDFREYAKDKVRGSASEELSDWDF